MRSYVREQACPVRDASMMARDRAVSFHLTQQYPAILAPFEVSRAMVKLNSLDAACMR
jgi:hypothetical protein